MSDESPHLSSSDQQQQHNNINNRANAAKRQREEEDEEEQHKRQAVGQGMHPSMKLSSSSSSNNGGGSSSSHAGMQGNGSNNMMQQAAAAAASSMNPMAGMMPMQSLGTGDLSAVAATLAPVLSAPGRAPVATPLHEKMQDPHYSQLMASWPEQLRRYAKRPQARRRVSVELDETERWYCPLQCGKYFKTTSTRSIAKHKSSCPKLPVNSHQQISQANSAVGLMDQNGASRASAAAAAAAASSGNAINPQAASALATAAAMGLLRIPQNNAPIIPFPFPMLGQQIGQQLMLQILQQNPQASASLLAAQQQQQQQQQLAQHQQNLMLQHQHQQEQQQQLLPHHQDALDGSEHLSNLPGTIKE